MRPRRRRAGRRGRPPRRSTRSARSSSSTALPEQHHQRGRLDSLSRTHRGRPPRPRPHRGLRQEGRRRTPHVRQPTGPAPSRPRPATRWILHEEGTAHQQLTPRAVAQLETGLHVDDHVLHAPEGSAEVAAQLLGEHHRASSGVRRTEISSGDVGWWER